MKIDEKYFNDFEGQKRDIESILMSEEKILWKDQPNRTSYILSSVFKRLPFVLIWLIFDATFIFFVAMGLNNGDTPYEILYFIIPFFILHLAPVWIWIYGIIKSAMELKNIEYVITDRRLIIKSGLVGIDFQSLTFSEIENINVKVGLIDHLCKVGDIYINSSLHGTVLYDIKDPYSLSSKLQKIVMDIKTDIEYPNDLRPKENHGYQTTYQNKDEE